MLDERPLTNGHSRRGVGRYVSGLFRDWNLDAPRLREHRAWSLPTVRRQGQDIRLTLPPRPRTRLDPLAARVVARIVDSEPPSVLHLTDPYGYFAAPSRPRVVATMYDLITYGARTRAGRAFTGGVRELLSRDNTVFVSISGTTANELMRRLGIRGENIVVVPPGPTQWPPFVPITEDSVIVLGALDPHKQPQHALMAAEIADVRVKFVGRHDPRLVTRWGLDPQQLVSDASDVEVAARLAGARCLVHTSAQEGFGLPVLEALTLGTPVVAYDLPVTRKIVGDAYPLVNLDEGPTGLAREISACGDERHRRALVQAAADTVRSYDWRRSRDLLLDLYRALGA